jgi:hypothetical protein
MEISEFGRLHDPLSSYQYVTVIFIHKKRKRWPKWMEVGGMWKFFSQEFPDDATTIRTYSLHWCAN